jgi:tripeptidyl-peptidase-1
MLEKHSWVEVPRGWEFVRSAPADHTLDMRVGLKQARFDELVESLFEVSDPSHEKYGAHLSKDQVEELVAPHPESSQLVEAWLAHHVIDPSEAIHRSNAGEWITLRIPVSTAERMLGAKYNVYRKTASSEYVVRTLGYSLPRVLHDHVDLVTPTTYFGTLQRMKVTSFKEPNVPTLQSDPVKFSDPADLPGISVLDRCNFAITPSCLMTLYNTTSYKPKATDKNTLGVAGYLDEFANKKDLQTFFEKFRKDAVGATFTTIQVHGGGDDQSKPGIEANLDIQYTEGLSFPTPNIYFSTGGSPPFKPDSQTPTNTNEPYSDWLDFILKQDKVPQTFTTSYGDDEQTVPPDYARSVCNRFAQLGARGSSILFSSGDFGVGGGDCKTNDGKDKVQFQPIFPASCPFVTAVGGTTKVNPEVVASFSGGGFSNYFAQPGYQKAAVSQFLKGLGDKYRGLFNKTGRGFPDVAAQGEGYQVVVGGQVESVGGTSASSPTFAAIVSLLNDFRISKGKAPLGFLNPLLYSEGYKGLNDITSGNNPGCGTQGFSAVKGWDPITGLGTPNFGKLQPIVLAAADNHYR